MVILRKIIPGNRYEIIIENDGNILLYDKTQQIPIAEGDNANELILFAQNNNMINGDAIIIS